MKKIILTIIYILTLSGCGLEQGSYLVRWWNGNIPTELSDKEKKYGIFVLKKQNYCELKMNNTAIG